MTAPWKGLNLFWHLSSCLFENCTVPIQGCLSPGAIKAFLSTRLTFTGPLVRIKYLKPCGLLYIWWNIQCLTTPFKIYSSTADISNKRVGLVAKGIASTVVCLSKITNEIKDIHTSQGGNDCQDTKSASTVKDFQLISHPRRLLLFNAFESKVIKTDRWGWHTLKCLIFL